VSIALGGFLSLSKPIGGFIFALAFWKISKIISYEKKYKNIHDYNLFVPRSHAVNKL
jgi:hypothetical protein